MIILFILYLLFLEKENVVIQQFPFLKYTTKY